LNRSNPSGYTGKHSVQREDTIAAISTPFGEGGIGIVRISGSLAESIVNVLFNPRKGYLKLVSHFFYYGEIVDPETRKPLDEVMVVLMRSPRSYTREDVVEIQCHGGYFVLKRVLELVLEQGARIAEPGEFTKRAYLSGRIDLTKAEAVIDLIKARTQTSLDMAHQQLEGRLFKEMNGLRTLLIRQLAMIETQIDFPEDEIDMVSAEELKGEVARIISDVRNWVESFEEGKVFREGIRCAIVGKSNVGKSSLFNVMVREERAIVTAIAGTTRDSIEEIINIDGLPVRLVDTAGLRSCTDLVEREGVRRARKQMKEADLVLMVIDGSRPLDREDSEIFKEIEGRKKVVAVNKNDLSLMVSEGEIREGFGIERVVFISAREELGVETLKRLIHESVVARGGIRRLEEHLIVNNARHKNVLRRIGDCLWRAMEGLEEGKPLELIAFEFRSALDAIGDMVGETTNEEILRVIFDEFCIGK
jgi:tRNA modification GTPase